MKKDILFLLQFFYPEYISSATLPFDTAKKLVDEGYSVDVLCGWPYEYINDEKVTKKQTVNNININRVKYLKLNKRRKLARLINFFSLTVAMFFKLFSLRKYKSIIVYTNPPILPLVAVLANKLFGCKLILVAYDLYPEIALSTNYITKNSIITKVMNYINNIVYPKLEAVVALSEEMKTYIAENRNISKEKIHVIPNWHEDLFNQNVDTSENKFVELVKDKFVLGYFGNMGVAQDMKPLIEALKHFKNDSSICFLLAGHGTKHLEVKKIIDQEKIENAYIMNFLQGRDYLDALKVSDCALVTLEKGLTGLCVPSKTYACMMQGVPLVAIMGESDIVDDVKNGAGYYISDNSVEEFINLITKIYKCPLEYKEKGKVSRQIYLEKYTPDVSLAKYVQLFKEVLQ